MKPYYEENGIVIYHGDCREILPSLPKVDLVLTDPPYGIDLNTDYTRFDGNSPSRKWQTGVRGDADPFDPIVWLTFPQTVLFGANYYSDKLPKGKWLVWNKRDMGASRVLADAELAWHNCKGKTVQVFNWFWIGCYRKGEMGDEVLHPTQKPLALMKWCLTDICADAKTILDPFMGSGTTLRAAKDLGRKAIGIEIEEKYCEIAARRLSQGVLDFGNNEQEIRNKSGSVEAIPITASSLF